MKVFYLGKEAARLRWEFEEERAGKGKSKHGNNPATTSDIFQSETSHSMAMLADLGEDDLGFECFH